MHSHLSTSSTSATVVTPAGSCRHRTLLPRHTTANYDICAVCGCAVYASTCGPDLNLAHAIPRGDRNFPVELCKQPEKQTWQPPPCAPRGKRRW